LVIRPNGGGDQSETPTVARTPELIGTGIQRLVLVRQLAFGWKENTNSDEEKLIIIAFLCPFIP